MLILSILRLAFALLSMALLVFGGWLVWSWFDGVTLLDEAGRAFEVREDWRLWTGVAILAWSLVGRFITRFFIARADTSPSRPIRGNGVMVASPTGSSLFVEASGPDERPTVVLTHGWGLDSTIWSYAKRDLGDRYRVVTWDLAGMGRSKSGPEGIRLDAFATDLRAVIDAASPLRPVVLVGHSIGGMTIQTLARDHAEFFRSRVSGVVLLNTTHTNPLRTMIFSPLLRAIQKPILEPAMKIAVMLQPILWVMAWQSYLSGGTHVAMRLGFGKYVTRSQLDHTALLTTRNAPGAQARGNLAMFHWAETESLARMSSPALVLAGGLDIVTKVEASQTIAGLIPGAALQIVEGVNHMGFLELAETYNDAIAGFVAEQDQRTAPRVV